MRGNIWNTFFGPHELSIAFRKVFLDSLLGPCIRLIFVIFFVEPNLLVVVYRPGIAAIPAKKLTGIFGLHSQSTILTILIAEGAKI